MDAFSTNHLQTWQKYLPFIVVMPVYVIGLFLDVMEIDAAQYAAMAREMLDSGDYLQLKNRGQDYLDKPPLLFWLSALSFKLLGVSNITYKLPSFLFSLLGLYATYRLGRLLYSKEVGYLAAIVLCSCQAYFLINHDIRTDTLLTGSVIFTIWQLAEYDRFSRFKNLLLAFTGIALAMLSKGPIGVMVPVFAFACNFAVKREWHKFFKWQWVMGIIWVLILLSPMMIGLYQQYGWHGLKFYFWTQSFGRITGENIWKDDSTPLYFTHTFAWAFLPWTVFFILSFFKELKILVRSKFRYSSQMEMITWGGFFLTFVAFSLSKYKLPHYIFVAFPLAAIITAKYLNRLLTDQKLYRLFVSLKWGQLFVIGILWMITALLVSVCFPLHHIMIITTAAILSLGAVYFFFDKTSKFNALIISSFLGITTVNLILNAHVYPQLFNYQSDTVAAKNYMAQKQANEPLIDYKVPVHYSIDFYSRRVVPLVYSMEELKMAIGKGPAWIYTNAEGLEDIEKEGLSYTLIKVLDEFHISTLTLEFLNPNSREKAIKKRYLLKTNDK